MIRIHDFIKHNVLQNVLTTTRPVRSSHDLSVLEKSRSRAKTKRGLIGIELQHHAHVGIERIESYASMKQRNKEKTQVIRTLGTLSLCLMILSFGLLLYTMNLKDSILLHQYQHHLEKVERR